MYKCEKCEREIKNKGGYVQHVKYCNLTKEIIKKIKIDYINNELSIRELEKIYKIGKNIITYYLGENKRTLSEANKIARKKHPEKFKHSDESKEKMRQARLKWMKENPEKTAWRQSNMSYPEKLFKEKIEELGLDKKYLIIRERSVFPYFIDFAFENQKVAVEIDGSQHELEDRKERDIKKDKLLKENGWRVYRTTAKQIKRYLDYVITDILYFLDNSIELDKKCGLYDGKTINQQKIDEERNRKKKERKINNGLTNKEIERAFKQRKVERPPYEQLMTEIKELGYRGTGKKYDISDNGVRKWKKQYEKYGK